MLFIASLHVWFESHTDECAASSKIEPGYNAMGNICCSKVEAIVNYNAEIRRLKKYRSAPKNLDDQTKSGRPKIVDSEDIL